MSVTTESFILKSGKLKCGGWGGIYLLGIKEMQYISNKVKKAKLYFSSITVKKSYWQVYFIAIPTPYVYYVSFISSIIIPPASTPQIVKTMCQLDGNRRQKIPR